MNTDRHLKNELSELAAERNARKIKELREGSTEKPIDWQKVRIQAAIAAMQGFCANPNYFELNSGATIPEAAIVYSDDLIEKLKGE